MNYIPLSVESDEEFSISAKRKHKIFLDGLWIAKVRGTQRQFSENICSEDDLIWDLEFSEQFL